MKSRMFVVNEKTLEESKRDQIAKVKVPIKEENENGRIKRSITKYFVSSTNSIMADMLQMELGDYIFFWCEKSNQSQKSTIHGVYRVISKPFYHFDDKNDTMPFKIKIEEAYHFEKPITEYDVLNSPFVKTSLWNIMGKKISGKSRGSIQITNEEATVLLSLLINKNPHYKFNPTNVDNYFKLPCHLPGIPGIVEPLKIDLSRCGEKLEKPTLETLNEYNMYNYVHLTKKRKLHNEKTLEGLFNQKIVEKNAKFFEKFDFDINEIIWFGNYLPYSLDATEMDYLIILSRDGFNPSSACVIEFKKEGINEIEKDTHFYRSIIYSKWVNENLFNGAKITRPIIVCEKCPCFDRPENDKELKIVNYYKKLETEFSSYNVLPVEIYTIDFQTEAPSFEKKK